jgi:BirA family biotin operon repressor/biotin-[acetyl-CoA-carboxylase] ligase
VNAALLARLRDADGAFVPLADLTGNDHLHLPAVRAELAEIEAFGYGLEWHPYRGVAYRHPARRLCPDWIEHDLGTVRIGRRIHCWARVGSTNDLAAQAAGSTANDGLVVLAESQTAGRGRHGRRWTAPAESCVLISVLLFPPPAWQVVTAMTTLGAVAAAEVVSRFAPVHHAAIKWPNDVRVERRKLAGVLVERRRGAWIVGIGLNVNVPESAFPDDLREQATSIERLTGGPVDRSEVARSLIQTLDRHYADGPEALETAWRSRLEALGSRVTVQTRTAQRFTGTWLDARFDRGLCLRPDGQDEPVWIASEDEPSILPQGFDNRPV